MKPLLRLSICLAVLALFLITPSSAEFYPADSGVLTLGIDTFGKHVDRDSHVSFVKFYSQGCGHCKVLSKTIIQAAKSLKGMAQVIAVDIDNESNKPLVDKYHIMQTPTLYAFAMGKSWVYKGPKTAKDIVVYMRDLIPQNVKTVTSETEGQFLAAEHDETPRVILFTAHPGSPLYKALALKFKDRYVFGEASDKEKKLAKNYFVDKYPSLQVLPPHGMPPVIYQGPYNHLSLNRFLKRFVNASETADFGDQYNKELPELIDDSCFAKYCNDKSGLCVLLFMYNEDKEVHYMDTLRAVEDTIHQPLLTYVWVNQEKHPLLLRAFGLEVNSDPQVVVLSTKKKRYSLFVGEFSVHELSRFLRKVGSGAESTYPINTDSGEIPALGAGTACSGQAETPSKVADPKRDTAGEGHKDETSNTQSETSTKSDGKDKTKRSGDKSKILHVGGVPPGVYVHEISRLNIDRLVKASHSPWIVLFTSTECKKCSKTLENWEKASKQGKNMVKYGQVNCSKEAKLCGKYSVTKFPHVKVFPAGSSKSKPHDYTGKRSPSVLHNYAMSLIQPDLVSQLDASGVQAWLSKDPGFPRMLLFSNKPDVPNLFAALATEFQHKLRFGFIPHTEHNLCSQFQVSKFPTLMVMGAPATAAQQGGLQAHKYDGKINFDALAQFLYSAVRAPGESVEEKIPTVHMIRSQADYKKGCLDNGGMCLVALFAPDSMRIYGEDKYEDEMDLMAAKNIKKPVNFLKANRFVQSAFTQVWGLADDGPVTAVLFNPRKKRWAGFVGVFDEEHVTEFIDAVLAGRIRTSTLAHIPAFVDDPTDEPQADEHPAKDEL